VRWLKLGKRTRKGNEFQDEQTAKVSTGKVWRWPRLTIDLNSPHHRRNLMIASLLVILGGLVFLVVSYKGYEYTESAEFCGLLCHPMIPQFVRYEDSPHVNVECVQCHIGPGASFFVRSKIDGLRQVYAVLANTYHRPILSPVHNLRPARETCETCHTPTAFTDNIVRNVVHYDNDEANTRIQTTLILKMGGWEESTGVSQGIHWHINSEVYYIAADEQRQVILWIGVKQPDGSLQEYYLRDMLSMAQTSFVEEARANGQMRLMDCIDCHNRAAHYIPSPQEAVDDAIEDNLISTNIPFIRARAVEVLSANYNNQAEALAAIDALRDFYVRAASEQGEEMTVASNSAIDSGEFDTQLASSLVEIRNIYSETNFPVIGLNWQSNPNNDRHTPSPGCFRCHDDRHVSVGTDGEVVETISVECNLCHTVPIVGRGSEMLFEAPVIVGATPPSHLSFSWTIEHRSVTDTEVQECYNCHGQAFCNNGACHNLSHPENMLYTHADEYRLRGNQVCYTCHQNILCGRCHPGGIVQNP
jgi:nitrate/TMAO reductase-like tetraheme cytochrome c subunit